MSSAPLSLPERRLAARLAAELARSLASDLEVEDDRLHNLGMSNYEAACGALAGLGLYRRTDQPTVFDVLVAEEEVEAAVLAGPGPDRDAFEALLDAMVGHLVGHAGILYGGRGAFATAPRLALLVEDLVRCGYLERSGAEVRWTGTLARAMRRWYLWDADGTSALDARRTTAAEEDARATRLAEALPLRLRGRIRAAMAAGEHERARDLILAYCDGDRWHLFPHRGPREKLTARVVIALMRRLRD